MKKFNLYNETISVNKHTLTEAINSNRNFAINIYGNICYEPYNENEIFIFKGQTKDISLSDNYNVTQNEQNVEIKAFSNWREISLLNIFNATYDDTTNDGIGEFSEETLEDIGWHATEFDISYRELADFIEDNCDGILLCIEKEEPYHFSGLGFISDATQAKEKLFKFCQNKIKNIIENDPDYKKENLSDDELDACEFFKI